MKKLGLLIAGILISTSVTPVFADQNEIACPSTWQVREKGALFSHAYLQQDNEWALISDPWYSIDRGWQTTYRLKLDGVTDPATAISIGQQYFDKSPLLTVPIHNGSVDNDKIVYCFYEPEGSNYLVTVTNGINYGINRKL